MKTPTTEKPLSSLPSGENSLAFRAVTREDELEQAKSLLTANGLAKDDFINETMLFVLTENGRIVGTGGLEVYGAYAFIRSISTDVSARGRGYGQAITAGLESVAQAMELHEVFLLTTTADRFFNRLGYLIITREDIPAPIKASAQFRHSCPSSAIAMRKILRTEDTHTSSI